MDLALGELGFRQLARDQHRAPAPVHFFGVVVSLVQREDENVLEHFDDVVVGMIVVVE